MNNVLWSLLSVYSVLFVKGGEANVEDKGVVGVVDVVMFGLRVYGVGMCIPRYVCTPPVAVAGQSEQWQLPNLVPPLMKEGESGYRYQSVTYQRSFSPHSLIPAIVTSSNPDRERGTLGSLTTTIIIM